MLEQMIGEAGRTGDDTGVRCGFDFDRDRIQRIDRAEMKFRSRRGLHTLARTAKGFKQCQP